MIFLVMRSYREDIKTLVDKIKAHDAEHDTFTLSSDLVALPAPEPDGTASSTTRSRRPSVIAQAADLKWLFASVEKFDALCWWTSSYQVAMRLMQTCAMVLIASPSAQAAMASLIALISVSVQTHTAPYRRPSDNRTALVATWVMFIWCAALLVRHSGAVSGEHGGVVLGVLLIVATAAMVGEGVWSLAMDVCEDGEKKEKREASHDAAAAAADAVRTETGGGEVAAPTRAIEEAGGAPSPAAPNDGSSSWDLEVYLCGSPENMSAEPGSGGSQQQQQQAQRDGAATEALVASLRKTLAEKTMENKQLHGEITALRE